MKKVILILLFVLMVGGGLAGNAFAATNVVDNDALSGAPGYNTVTGTWTYRTGSGYNGDHRIKSATSSGFSTSSYIWNYHAKSKKASYAVYLNHRDFNNPATYYQTGENGGYKAINQHLASAGWNSLKTVTARNIFISINTSLTSKSGNVGVDATRITY